MMSNAPKTRIDLRSGDTDMSAQEYKIIQDFLAQTCGIALSDSKQYLVKNRLISVLRKFNFSTITELTNQLKVTTTLSSRVRAEVIDAMTTNETFWFRDDMQFLELKEKVFPELFKKKTGPIRIWSAACSSGQEPYSISMCASDMAKGMNAGRSGNIQIIGTDISEKILNEAKQAVYSEMALSRGLGQANQKQYFQKIDEGYKVKPDITARVRFQQFNLLKPFSVLGRFDIVFCRNVLIYFSDDVKRDILTRMASSLEPGGYLFLSSTESMPVGMKELQPVRGRRARYFQKVG